ncbi:hypothetical protein A3A09_02135 [Candidatus Nomurabacteria bacterium RIFCSPLOWO2_01_FULL_42_20]|uniref:DUF4258 domain-containing protein n=1 Tax=Candidatus Nomurabacteria bacterium RIFCSPHIGHO2_01_FULL_42_16 TaxID=1801743 RepID=A0A1F6VL76_9BACT|nr:MAG: hypothetical protein A2824_02405 [Candidatus Nomurabacteria bacterium RIFCSPHIGHO2_01_FULL_42_16]OGI91525.1 MAG: hypothetical protein A3A09_02135 [Candidatus Nomurabacteria bacterium RIFCSPLOWO2_01_FULL_42_20]
MFQSYIIKAHAKQRIRERGIKEELIKEALFKPTKILYDVQSRILIKKLYKKGGKERLLLIAGEIKNDLLEIITVIETSKVKKYL